MNTATENLVILQSYDNLMQAEIAKSILDSAGIFCSLRNEYMSMVYPIGAMPSQLMVREEDLEQAQRLLVADRC